MAKMKNTGISRMGRFDRWVSMNGFGRLDFDDRSNGVALSMTIGWRAPVNSNWSEFEGVDWANSLGKL